MRTNAKARKTMPEEWVKFFNAYKNNKRIKTSKYFKTGGNQCCACRPEGQPDEKGNLVVQASPRRVHPVPSFNLDEKTRKKCEKIFGRSNFRLGILYVTSCHSQGGIYLYDAIELKNHGYLFKTVPRHGQDYYLIPLKYCYKTCDIWDLPGYVNYNTLYQVARWQYEEDLNNNETGERPYDHIKTWQDLPDYCLWKWTDYNGNIIPGREEAFEEYKAKIKRKKDYIPPLEF